ncbi:hypothetical protein [Krasilnikovia sp. M28-CT-15]|uniref:hypothetical protein n=1 Tax=Krasilnikovia sp. M28-CT-15 TaxID=3373540 RepID=UPI00399C8168
MRSSSLTAQLAVAKPGPSGWVVSALPALAFLGLSKLVFTATTTRPTTDPVTAETPATSRAPSPDTTRPEDQSAAATPQTRATAPIATSTPATKTTARTPADKTNPALAPTITADSGTDTATAPAAPVVRTFPAPLLANARTLAASHHDTHGEPISSHQLAVRLRVPTTDAADILTQLATNPPAATTKPHNGNAVGVNA